MVTPDNWLTIFVMTLPLDDPQWTCDWDLQDEHVEVRNSH